MTQTGGSAAPDGEHVSRWGNWRRTLAGPLLLAVVAQNIGNLIFHAVVGRYLPAADYGALGTVLSLMVLLTVPLGALQAAAAAEVARHGWSWPSIRRALVLAGAWGTAFGVVCLILAPIAVDFFKLDSLIDAALLAPFVTISIVLAVARGLLLGAGRVSATAATFIVSTVGRLAAGFALLPALGVTGALLGTVIGEAAALLSALWLARREPSDPAGSPFRLRLRPVVVSGIAIGGLFIFTTVDLFLARHFLPGGESGSYVAAATIAKTVLALPAAVLAAAFPRLVSAHGTARWTSELRRTLVVVVGLALVAALVIAAFPQLVLTVLFGANTFPDAAVLVRTLALIAGAGSFVSVLTYAALAGRSWAIAIPWGGVVLEVGLIQLAHANALEIVRGSAIALAITAVAMALAIPTIARGRAAKAPVPAPGTAT